MDKTELNNERIVFLLKFVSFRLERLSETQLEMAFER